jgi:hypothetical protein
MSRAYWKISSESGHDGSWEGVVMSSIGINSRIIVQSRVYPLAVDRLDARVSNIVLMIGFEAGRRYSRIRKRASPMHL